MPKFHQRAWRIGMKMPTFQWAETLPRALRMHPITSASIAEMTSLSDQISRRSARVPNSPRSDEVEFFNYAVSWGWLEAKWWRHRRCPLARVTADNGLTRRSDRINPHSNPWLKYSLPHLRVRLCTFIFCASELRLKAQKCLILWSTL